MLKEAIEKIEAMAQPIIQEVEGRTVAITPQDAFEIRPEPDRPDTLPLTSLDALVKLVKTEGLAADNPLYITIPSHTLVQCFGQFHSMERCYRQFYYEVNATDVPGWEAKVQLPFEEAMIALRTRFQPTPDTDYALKLLSEITTGAKITFNDSGIATSVVTKRGIDLQTNQAIRPIVTLRPYRTFQEVEQPASQFLIRVNERGIQFVEADGGMWKLHARQTVQTFLQTALEVEIQDASVVVAL